LLELEAPFSRPLALRYLRDLCAGLEYAHERGLVHADFKPGNVFVTASGVAKILDFGIAQAIAKPLGRSRFSDNKVNALTPAYATCEMIAGEPPAASDDVYALACVLYYMLTGSHPYNMKSAEAVALEDLSPLQPDSLTDAEWPPLLKALSCDQAQRPDSISAFRDTVLAALANDTRQHSDNIQRNPNTPVLMGGVAALGITALLVVALLALNFIGDPGPETDEQLEFMLAKVEDCLAADDLNCASESYQLAMGRAPGDERMAALGTRIQALQSAQTQRTISTLIKGGLSCQSQRNYDCMADRANAILALDPEHEGARQLLNDAETIRAAEAERARKAKRNIDIQ